MAVRRLLEPLTKQRLRMLPVMAENPEDRNLRDRFQREVRTESDEIQDWINANGAMVLAAITVFIVLWALYALVLS